MTAAQVAFAVVLAFALGFGFGVLLGYAVFSEDRES